MLDQGDLPFGIGVIWRPPIVFLRWRSSESFLHQNLIRLNTMATPSVKHWEPSGGFASRCNGLEGSIIFFRDESHGSFLEGKNFSPAPLREREERATAREARPLLVGEGMDTYKLSGGGRRAGGVNLSTFFLLFNQATSFDKETLRWGWGTEGDLWVALLRTHDLDSAVATGFAQGQEVGDGQVVDFLNVAGD